MKCFLALCALLFLSSMAACGQPNPPDYLWWEAENPGATNFPPNNPFAPQNEQEADVLSGGKWIGASGEFGKTLFLEYEVHVPREGVYSFYARKFWKHGPFRWRFGAQPWQICGEEVALLDSADLRQFVGANWVALGITALKAGPNRLRIELLKQNGAAAFDCFLLTRSPFTPNGKLKPGMKRNRAPAGWFPFEPDTDTFEASPIDLRGLNEKVAGENGFIQAKGAELIHAKTGQPIRFWAVNAGPDIVRMDKTSVEYLARLLAKRGVNLVRLHGSVWKDDLSPDTAMLDKMFQFIAALKKEGIYSCLSIYFPLWVQLKPEHGFAGYDGKHPFALLFFNPQFQEKYKAWWRAVLTTPNPYTKVPLNQEPAVAIAELCNEDSYFFWTFTPYENIPGPQIALLEKQFGSWLAKRYGSLPAALARWGGEKVRGDEAAAGRAGFMPLWAIFNQKSLRAQDTATFLTQHQKAFFQQMTTFLKKDLGFQGSVYASNWVTADATTLGPLDKYSNTVADIMDRHGYFGGKHEGPRAGYALDKGDRYRDRSALLFSPEDPDKSQQPSYDLPLMEIGYNDKPSLITEINWPMPNRFRADMPLLSAAYGRLQGSDGYVFFALTGPSWQQSHHKFGIMSPVILGQFPATALIFRKGLVKTGEAVVRVERKLSDLFALKGAPVRAAQNLDEFRAKDVPPGQPVAVKEVASIDPLAFLVGRVELNVTEAGGTSKIVELSKYINREAKTVRSMTGELLWDYGRGVMTVNAPQAQGATGFLAKAGRLELDALTLQSPMEYGAVLLVALDNQPLTASKKMLLQVASEDKDFDWEASGEGMRTIQSLGGPPIVVKQFAGTVTLKRPDADALRITPLDANGYPVGAALSGAAISLRPTTMYYLIEKGR